jgi:hypothetical protein
MRWCFHRFLPAYFVGYYESKRISTKMSITLASIGRDIRSLVLVSVLLMSSGFTFGQESVANVVKQSSDAVVLIVTSDSNGQETALGSGFLISADGEIVTNFHVIEGAQSAVVKLPTGAIFPVGGVLAHDPDRDLAILKVSGKDLPFLTLGGNRNLQAGEHVIAIGSPLGLEGTVTDGIVSSIRESDGKKWIQTTAPISHGNSGGPLLDMRGRVIGVVTLTSKEGQNLNFAIPADDVKVLFSNNGDVTPLAAVSGNRSSEAEATSPDSPQRGAISQSSAGEQRGVEQLRAIAKAIGECTDYETSWTSPWGYTSGTHFYAPINVIWDIERTQSYRSQALGYVEFVQRTTDIRSTMKDCKKRDDECNARNRAVREAEDYVAAAPYSPSQYRYEFDFGSQGLEFSRAFWKHESDDASHWAATSLNDHCEGRAVRTVLNAAAPAKQDEPVATPSQDSNGGYSPASAAPETSGSVPSHQSTPSQSSSSASSVQGKSAWVSCPELGTSKGVGLFEDAGSDTNLGLVNCGEYVRIQEENSTFGRTKVVTSQGVSGWISQLFLEISASPGQSTAREQPANNEAKPVVPTVSATEERLPSFTDTVWTSVTSGIDLKLRTDGDFLYAEQIFSDEEVKAGAYRRMEFRKDSDGKWQGKIHGAYPSEKDGYVCELEYDGEIDSLSPTRIEGVVEVWESFDSRKCKWKGKQLPQAFVWIPK